MTEHLEKKPDETEQNYIHFNIVGIVWIVSDWLKRNCPESPELVTHILMKFIPDEMLKMIW